MAIYIQYDIQFEQVTESKSVESNCADILFTNKGDGIARVNNYPLEAGETVGFSANLGEICVTNFQISFDAGATTQSVFIARKYYA